LTALEGKEKWTAYKFTRNVYDVWMPTHLKRICSVITQWPLDLGFEVVLQFEEASGPFVSSSRTSKDDNELASVIPQ
jgi:hypothetical protein